MSQVSMCDAPPLSQIMIVDFAALVRGAANAGATTPRALVPATRKAGRSTGDPANNGKGSIVTSPESRLQLREAGIPVLRGLSSQDSNQLLITNIIVAERRQAGLGIHRDGFLGCVRSHPILDQPLIGDSH